MRFTDRADAGHRLAAALPADLPSPVIVLGIARGGVVVARAVADAIGAPCAVAVVRKLGAPDDPELAIGAIAPGVRVLDERTVAELGVSVAEIDAVVEREERELARREARFRAGRAAVDLTGATALVVDDGLATGATAVAAVRWARARGADRVVLAAPVASAQAAERLRREADALVVLATPDPFVAVGDHYDRFEQVSDAEVIAALDREAA